MSSRSRLNGNLWLGGNDAIEHVCAQRNQTSTRRFFSRPSSVSLEAIGKSFPNPLTTERLDASHLQLIGDRSGAIFGKGNILLGSASAIGETEQEETPLLVGWIRQ